MKSKDFSTQTKAKESIADPKFDQVLKDKLTEEQMEDMDDFKSVVFETERQKQEARKEHK
jgi:hypothetical protein